MPKSSGQSYPLPIELQFIFVLYRPPDLSSDPLMQLRLSLNRITQRSADLPNIILTGDFNLPSIEWLDGLFLDLWL